MTEPTSFPDTAEGAMDLIRWMADLEVGDKIRAGLAAGSLELIPDPSVKGVWGVVRKGTEDAVVVIWTGDRMDFTLDDEWLYS